MLTSKCGGVLRRDHAVPELLGLPPRPWAALLRIALLGVDATAAEPIVAAVMCSGLTDLTKKDMEYQGAEATDGAALLAAIGFAITLPFIGLPSSAHKASPPRML